MLRLVFMGSDAFAVPILRRLIDSPHRVEACVTQPDRPQGRGRVVQPCPVKREAEVRGLLVFTPEKVGEAFEALSAIRPDVIVVAAYGQFIPSKILKLPAKGCVNVHPSLLPKYRGAAPVQWAIANGESVTGVTIAEVTPKMDAGPILLQEVHPVDPADTAQTLECRLSEIGASLLIKALDLIESGNVVKRPQSDAEATWARKLEKNDGLIDWSLPARDLHNRVRAFQPWPGTYFYRGGRRIGVLQTRVEPGNGLPGTILEVAGDGPVIACGKDALRLLRLLPEGKRAMSGAEFLRGARWKIGDVLSAPRPPESGA